MARRAAGTVRLRDSATGTKEAASCPPPLSSKSQPENPTQRNGSLAKFGNRPQCQRLCLRSPLTKGWCLFLQRHPIVVAVPKNKSGGQGAGKPDHPFGAANAGIADATGSGSAPYSKRPGFINPTPPGNVFKSRLWGKCESRSGLIGRLRWRPHSNRAVFYDPNEDLMRWKATRWRA